jgi:hypothetical protein
MLHNKQLERRTRKVRSGGNKSKDCLYLDLEFTAVPPDAKQECECGLDGVISAPARVTRLFENDETLTVERQYVDAVEKPIFVSSITYFIGLRSSTRGQLTTTTVNGNQNVAHSIICSGTWYLVHSVKGSCAPVPACTGVPRASKFVKVDVPIVTFY